MVYFKGFKKIACLGGFGLIEKPVTRVDLKIADFFRVGLSDRASPGGIENPPVSLQEKQQNLIDLCVLT